MGSNSRRVAASAQVAICDQTKKDLFLEILAQGFNPEEKITVNTSQSGNLRTVSSEVTDELWKFVVAGIRYKGVFGVSEILVSSSIAHEINNAEFHNQ